jgi:hypothetical protein
VETREEREERGQERVEYNEVVLFNVLHRILEKPLTCYLNMGRVYLYRNKENKMNHKRVKPSIN